MEKINPHSSFTSCDCNNVTHHWYYCDQHICFYISIKTKSYCNSTTTTYWYDHTELLVIFVINLKDIPSKVLVCVLLDHNCCC
jgi:hypothetical protein